MIDDPEREKVLRRIMDWLNIQKTDVVLDIGCGDGFFLKRIASQTSDVNVVGGDIRMSRKGKFNLPMVIYDAQQLPFRDKTVNKIIMNEVLEHLPNGELACNELSRVLVEAGRVYIATPNSYKNMLKPFTILARRVDIYEGHLKHFSSEELNRMLFRNRLKIIHFQYDGFFALFLYYSIIYYILKPLAERKSTTSSHHLLESGFGKGWFFQLSYGLGKYFLFILGKFDELFKASNKGMGIHLVVIKSSKKS
jgi:SAM-dependent methyltransferase